MRGKDANKYRKRSLKSGDVYEVLLGGKWKSTGQYTLERAMTWTKKQLAQAEGDRVYFRDFAQGFYAVDSPAMQRRILRGKLRSAGWYVQSQARLETYIMPYFGDCFIDEMTTPMIDKWLLDLQGPKGAKISAATKNKVMVCLKNVLQDALAQGLIKEHPMASLEAFTEHNKERSVFTTDELERFFPAEEEMLINIWGSVLWACYFMVLRDTGHRMGEQAVLRWDDLFCENGQYGFVINKSMDWFTKETKPTTKTGYSRATLITAHTYEWLMRHKERHAWDLIFTLDGRRGIIAETARKHLRHAAKNAGIDLLGRTPYCFRHTANTNLLLRADAQQVRFLMGHRTEKETTNYNHPDKRLLAKKAAAIKLEEI